MRPKLLRLSVACRFLLSCIVLFVAVQIAAAVEFDFDSVNDLQQFNQNSESFYTPFNYDSTAGTSGSGGLTAGQSHQATYKSQAYEMTRIGDSVESSVMLKVADPLADTNNFGKLYFVGASDAFANAFVEALDVELRENSSNVQLSLISSDDQGNGRGSTDPIPKGSLEAGHWYELRTKLTYVDRFRHVWRAELNDFGLTGETLLGNVSTFQESFFAASLLFNNDAIYAGFAARSGTTAMDNFSVASGRLDVPTESVQLEATFDVQATVGSVTTLTEGGAGILVGDDGSLPTGDEATAIFEFSLEQLPPGALILSADLNLDLNVVINTPQLRIAGYSGDGLASVSDVDSFARVLNPGFNVDTSSTLAPLDPAVLNSYLDDSHIGIRIENLTADSPFFLNSMESAFPPPNTTLTLEYFVPADFNRDGSVDAADYTIWRNNLGTEAVDPFSAGDADGDGDIDREDYLRWREAYSPQASQTLAAASAPEPVSLILLVVVIPFLVFRRAQKAHGILVLSP